MPETICNYSTAVWLFFFLFSYSEVSVKCEGYRLMSMNEMRYMYVCVIGLIERKENKNTNVNNAMQSPRKHKNSSINTQFTLLGDGMVWPAR